MKSVIALLLFAAYLPAQSLAVTSPTAGQSVSGSAITLSATCTTCPSLYTIEYWIGDRLVAPAHVMPLIHANNIYREIGGYSLAWNSYQLYNGNAHIYAVARDALGVLIATSPIIRFTVANPYYNQSPPYTAAAGGRTPSLSCTDPNTGQVIDAASNAPSTWTGTVSISCTVTGATAGEVAGGIYYAIAVGGTIMNAGASPPSGVLLTTATPTLTLDTTKAFNGAHLISIVAKVLFPYPSVTGTFVFGQWTGNVTFSNGATPMELRLATRDQRVNVGDTATVTGSIVNTDGTTAVASSPTFALNTFAHLNSTNSCTVNAWTGVVTFVAPGSCPVTMTSGGFSRTLWYYVGTGVDVLNFGTDGSILTNYVKNLSYFESCVFQNNNDFPPNEQEYLSYGSDLVAGGHNCVETGFGSAPTQGQSSASWTTALNATITAAQTMRDTYCPTCFLHLIGDGFLFGNDDLWQLASGASSAWSPLPGVQLMTLWGGIYRALHADLSDEVNTKYACPLCAAQTPAVAGPFVSITAKAVRTAAGTTDTLTPADCNRSVSYTNSGAITATLPSSPGSLPFACIFHLAAAGSGTVTVTAADSFSAGISRTISPGNRLAFMWNASPTLHEWNNGRATIGNNEVCLANYNSAWPFINGSGQFIITGGTTSAINSVAGTVYTQAQIVDISDGSTYNDRLNNYEFDCPNVSGDLTVDHSTDPGLIIQIQAAWWMNSSTGLGCCGDPAAGSPPWNSYVPYNGMATIISQFRSVTPRPKFTWAVLSHTVQPVQYEWMGDPNSSDYATFYSASTGCAILDAFNQSCAQMEGDNTDFISELRVRQGWMLGPRAWFAETSGIINQYGTGGVGVSVTSCNNETLVLASPHGIGTVVPLLSRVRIVGGSCAGDYYVFAAPNATTLLVALSKPNFNASVGTVGTITWEDSGATTGLGGFSSSTSSYNNTFSPYGGSVADCNPLGLMHTGERFHISGSGDSNVNANRYVYGYESGDRTIRLANQCFHQNWHQLPSASGSGGTAYIVKDNNFIPGASYNNGPFGGPNQPFQMVLEVGQKGGTGQRVYTAAGGMNVNARSLNAGYNGIIPPPSTFDSGDASWQNGMHPYWDSGDQKRTWYGQAMGTRLVQAMLPFLYSPKASVPDEGPTLDCDGRKGGAAGNFLGCVNVSDDVQTRTFDFTTACGTVSSGTLTPGSCLIGGQNFLRYIATWRGIAITVVTAGVTTDSPIVPAGGLVWYAFPANFAAEYAPRTISARLADVPGATQIVLHWGYDLYSLDAQTGQTTDCGTGICTPPADPKIGVIYGRYDYLDVNGKTLAKSDVQVF